MGTVQHPEITSGSIADYLDDIERRFGVRLAFTLQCAIAKDGEPILSIALVMPHAEHRAEIPWWKDQLAFLSDKDSKKLLRVMWDLLFAGDRKIEKGR